MDDFVAAGGWFERYERLLGGRFVTFKLALNILRQQGGRRIVETGSLREPGAWLGDGCATYLFGEFAAAYGLHLWTCDIDPDVIETAKQVTAPFAAHITYVCADSVAFLESFPAPIDLLYLDSFDCPTDGDATAAQTHNLRELEAAFPHLNGGALVLLDDNRWANGGKTRRSKDFLHAAGWLCLYDADQSLWISSVGLTTNLFTSARNT